MWANAEALRTLSQALTWAAFILAVLAAGATVGRYFVDRLANELSAAAAAESAARAEAERKSSEAALRVQLAQAEARTREAREQAAATAAATEALRLAQQPRAERLRTARAGLVGELRKLPSVRVRFSSMAGDTESSELGAELRRLFADAGWPVGPVDGVITPGNPQGILFRHGPKSRSGSRVLAVLRSAGLDIEEAVDNDRDDIAVEVFFKPRAMGNEGRRTSR